MSAPSSNVMKRTYDVKLNKLMQAMMLSAPLILAGCNSDDNDDSPGSGNDSGDTVASSFVRVATLPVCTQLDANCDTDTQTAAEIVDVSEDGQTLIYTDSPQGVIGFVDIRTPDAPSVLGTLALGGEPTSVAVRGDYALVGVNTSASFTSPSGQLAVVDIASRSLVTSIDLGGQPDSVAVSPDKAYAAIAIENERDEDLDDGRIDLSPQAPAGYLVVANISDADPSNWTTQNVDMTGLASVAATDPEPEYVDINGDNVAVVTLQENNHIVLVDLATAAVTDHFSAGDVSLDQVDIAEEDIIDQTGALANVAREPDGVTWIDNTYFVTADEGDMNGGSRGFTVFNTGGDVAYTSGNELEHLTARLGHYPESRSENKGNEPENAEFGQYGDHPLLIVNSERSSLVLVYDVSNPESPEFLQALPAAAGPEGVKAITSRNLLVVASEEDDRGTFRGAVNIYSYGEQDAAYPMIESADRNDGTPIPFAALSGLAADLSDADRLWSIEDSAFQASRIFGIDISDTPANLDREIRITDGNGVLGGLPTSGAVADDDSFDDNDRAALVNGDGTVNLDPEGIAAATNGGFWIATEGSGTVGDVEEPVESLNMVIKTDAQGVITDVVTLPASLNNVQRRFGFEGIAEYNGKLYVAFQRAWNGEANPRIGIYDLTTETWTFPFYPLDAVESQNGGWVGLSDLTSLGDGTFLVLERDNQFGPDAAIKRVYRVNLASATDGSTVTKTLVRDLVPDLTATGGLVPEKVEGLAVTANGDIWINNDNDGVDDNSGENQLLNIGNTADL